MAAPTTKLPAPQPTARGAVAPAAKEAQAATGGGTSGGFKALTWLLVVLNLAAAGVWLWFKFFKNSDSARTLQFTTSRLVKLQTDLDNLHATVVSIGLNGVNEVSDPGRLVADVASSPRVGIREFLSVSQVSEQKFFKTSYTEKSVKVTFLNKKGYKFSEIVYFLNELERANPTVQIKDIDFGKRTPPATGSDTWIPTVATVRTLQLSSGG